MKNILITGGMGFIGSHTCLDFLEEGFNITIIDSLKNSSKNVLKGLKEILELSNNYDQNKISFHEGDIRNTAFLQEVFFEAKKKNNPIDGVIHFAGLKAVKESILDPILYWDVNVNGSINLFKIMEENNCKTILFSSSATVYGDSQEIPFKESALIKPFNTYGYTKAAVENILKNIFNANSSSWRIGSLRYFNPIGSHPSGLIGENPNHKPENIFPYICQVASGLKDKLYVFGNDWPTPDGTCYRDYIHVVDLAEIHKKTLKYLVNKKSANLTLNVGNGKSHSVLELINTFERVNNIKINYEFSSRRVGDIAISYADTSKMYNLLRWKPSKSVEDMCIDGWNWHKKLVKSKKK
tara:strand:- start:6826 stop:7884 length:1059 start_codon:yes stop_codon:yes gene_type:complete